MTVKLSLDALQGVPRTLLIPLRGRYLETIREDGLISDPKAVEIFEAIDHDFGGDELPRAGQMLISSRTVIFDEAVSQYIKKFPGCTVVNLGCGLDTRFFRVDDGTIRWYDLDLPETIALRKLFIEPSDRLTLIAKSVLDFSWLDEIKHNGKVLFIAEGLFNYFSEENVKKIILSIARRFPEAELIFEAHSPLIKQSWHKHSHVKNALSMFDWCIHSGKILEKWDPSIRFVKHWYYVDVSPKRWGLMRAFRYVPLLKQIMKAVQIRIT